MNRSLAIAALCGALVSPIAAQTNLLSNPNFDAGGLAGWQPFGNANALTSSPPAVVPHTGDTLVSMFGNFTGGFNVTGIFQEFPASAGQNFTMDCWSRHFSGDALTGGGAPNFNWVVMKIAFFDVGGTEIAGFESTILDGTSPTDTWIDNTPISGVAPAGTAKVQALVLFLQPGVDGGAAHIDTVEFFGPQGQIQYPGTGEDLEIATGLGGAPVSNGVGNDVKQATANTVLEVQVSSPNGGYDFRPYLVLGQLFTTGAPPSPTLPKLYLDFSMPVAFFVGAAQTPIGGPVIVPAGSSSYFMLPGGLAGNSLMLQAVVLDTSAANSLFAASNGHEIQLQ